ncbi:MAG: DUF58 domain-containing protein [Dongiaceae bacterium]
MPINPQALQNRAESLAARLPPLTIEAERIAATVVMGLHGQRRPGSGDHFWQYRLYQQQDDASKIDWRRSAKGQGLYVRQNEWDVAQTIWVWRDASQSMNYKSQRNLPTKRQRADLLLLSLLALLARGGERFALLASGIPPVYGRSGLLRLADFINQPYRDSDVSQSPSLPPLYILPRYAQVVLIGDFLSPLKDTKKIISRFSSFGLKGHLLQILDPAERDLPFKGHVRFTGMEGEDDFLAERADELHAAYSRRLRSHRRGLTDLCASAGWSISFHTTDQPPSAALLDLYRALNPVHQVKP